MSASPIVERTYVGILGFINKNLKTTEEEIFNIFGNNDETEGIVQLLVDDDKVIVLDVGILGRSMPYKQEVLDFIKENPNYTPVKVRNKFIKQYSAIDRQEVIDTTLYLIDVLIDEEMIIKEDRKLILN